MFCSGCGVALAPGQPVCSQCGRPVAPPVPPIPGLEFEVQQYHSHIHTLGVVWFVYAALTIVVGLGAMMFAHSIMMGGFGHWAHGPFPPPWLGAVLRFGWFGLLIRVAIAIAAGYGLMEHSQWGKIVAIIAAILSLIHFPLGTALGIWTLVMLLGYRHSTLYGQL